MNTNQQQRAGVPAQSRFVWDTSLFSTSLLVGGFCGIIRAFFLAKVLGPQAFGSWRFVNIFLDYIDFASLGTQPAVHQRIPFLRGKGDHQKVHSVLNTVFAAGFFSSIFYGLMVFVWSFLIKEPLDARALAAFSPVILLVGWLNYANGLTMATALYPLRTRLEAMHAILTMVCSVALVYLWGIYGAIAGLGISASVVIALYARTLAQYAAFALDWRILFDLILTGFPMMANGILLTGMSGIDKIIIAAMLSRETLGIYGVASAATAILGTIPSAVGQMLFVKFAEIDGQQRTKAHVADILERSTLLVSILFSPIVSISIICFPFVVEFLLPSYSTGIAAGKFLIASTFFLCISCPATNWCISTGSFIPVLTLRVIVIVVEAAAIYILISSAGAGLESIALCVMSSFAIFSASIIVICHRLLGQSFQSSVTHAAKSILPFGSILAAILVPGYLYSGGRYPSEVSSCIPPILGMVASLTLGLLAIYMIKIGTQISALIPKKVLRVQEK